MSNLPTNPSEAFRKRNPHIYSGSVPQAAMDKKITAGLSRRLRQDRKPLMNVLEAEWFRVINVQNLCYPRPRPQAKRYQIGNGAWYKPDFTSSSWPVDGGPAMETAWECKGPERGKNVARGKLALKTAAHQWPEVAFYLVSKAAGGWQVERVLP